MDDTLSILRPTAADIAEQTAARDIRGGFNATLVLDFGAPRRT